MGLFDDAYLTQSGHSNANTLYSVEFIVGQVPGMYLMQKLPMGRFMVGVCVSWSVIILLGCTVTRFSGLAAVGFFLGIFEAVVLPLLNKTMALLQMRRRPVLYCSTLAALA